VNSLPIICTLTASELQERRRTILSSIRAATRGVVALADGFAYSFDPTSQTLTELTKLVDLERQCCQFLTFKVIVEPQSLIRLEVTGPSGSMKLIEDFLGGV
jgi:hypothetical protein